VAYKKDPFSDEIPPAGLDLWIMAGQSNMEGYGILEQDPKVAIDVWNFASGGGWEKARDPLHWLWESLAPVDQRILRLHQQENDPYALLTDDEIVRRERSDRVVGTGLGIPFAEEMVRRTGRPVGLIPAAHGGTTLNDWGPDPRGPNGDTLYGALLIRVERALAVNGSAVRGVLWFQGEADATAELSATYEARLEAWVAALRRDLGQPDLVVLLVQLGRLVTTPTILEIGLDSKSWSAIREAHRLVAERVPNVRATSAIDLGLSDEIHLNSNALHRLGRRLARRACDCPSPKLLSVSKFAPLANGKPTLLARFDGVTGGWARSSSLTGFEMTNEQGDSLDQVRVIDIYRWDDVGTLRIVITAEQDEMFLAYGQGFNPDASMTDHEDNPLLAFGPAKVEPSDMEAVYASL
jgi:sialate O-acetylesterase